MSSDDDLVPVFIPALVALLIQAEELNGAPLTRNQAIAIRDNADCVMLPPPAKDAMEMERGYSDSRAGARCLADIAGHGAGLGAAAAGLRRA
jgi:hypothetical protein